MLGFIKRIFMLPHMLWLFLWAAPSTERRAGILLAEEENLLMDAELNALRECSQVAYHKSRSDYLRTKCAPELPAAAVLHQIKP